MEDVLDVFTRPYDPQYPQVCMDETCKQLLADVRDALPIRPNYPHRVDYEYKRHGVTDLFIFLNPCQESDMLISLTSVREEIGQLP